MKIKVLIVEDEAPAFRRLQRILEEIDPQIEIIDLFDTVEGAVKWFEAGNQADLIFMDIQLADGLSFEIFRRVEIKQPVIFTTAYDEYTLKAFEVNSIDYLLKPIDKERLQNSLSKWEDLKKVYSGEVNIREILEQIQPEGKKYRNRFLVRSRDQLIPIKTSSVSYFYTESSIVYLKRNDGKKYPIDSPLDALENELNPEDFFRINRQYLCNIEAISSSYTYDKGKIMIELEPKADETVLVSKDKASQFKKWLEGK